MRVDEPGVSIDLAHAHLLFGLVTAHKPSSVLEFGFGGGRSAETILRALAFNQQEDTPYTLVDNWIDWHGEMPVAARAFAERYAGRIHLLTRDEGAFVRDCQRQFDLIMSDADHYHANEWFTRTYDVLLAQRGILIYHDVCNYPNLAEIVTECERRALRYVVFQRCSVPGEACFRGLLVIFKPQE